MTVPQTYEYITIAIRHDAMGVRQKINMFIFSSCQTVIVANQRAVGDDLRMDAVSDWFCIRTFAEYLLCALSKYKALKSHILRTSFFSTWL
jgi:hypothetical protein